MISVIGHPPAPEFDKPAYQLLETTSIKLPFAYDEPARNVIVCLFPDVSSSIINNPVANAPSMMGSIVAIQYHSPLGYCEPLISLLSKSN